jgi:pyridoxamine 5'-phosphate oxidase
MEGGAMVLATASASGAPNARYVLLRGLDGRGLVFFTNYESAKARELEENPVGAVVFAWPQPDQKSVRVRGPVEKTSAEESDAYFHARARGSQLGAWASPQSRPMTSRAELEAGLAEVEARFGDGPVPRPPNWGGYRLVPAEIEFWQGRRNRLHERELWTRSDADGAWSMVILGP